MSTVKKLLLVAVMLVGFGGTALTIDPAEITSLVANGVREDVVINIVASQGLSRSLTGQDIYNLNAVGASATLVTYLASAPVTYVPAPVVVQSAPVYVQSAPVYVPAPPVYVQPAPVRRNTFSLGLFFGNNDNYGPRRGYYGPAYRGGRDYHGGRDDRGRNDHGGRGGRGGPGGRR